MKKVIFLLAMTILIGKSALAQEKVTIDTTKVPVLCLYLVDSVQGTTATAYLHRVSYFTYQLTAPKGVPDGDTSFVVKKTKLLQKRLYYLVNKGVWKPVNFLIDFDYPQPAKK